MYLLHHLLNERPGDDTRIALVEGDASLTYAGFAERVHDLSARLVGVIAPGDRVAIYLPKGMAECVAIFAIAEAGGVFVPVNPQLRPAQLRHILSDCGARLLVTNAALADGLGEAIDALTDLANVLTIDPKAATGQAPAHDTAPGMVARFTLGLSSPLRGGVGGGGGAEGNSVVPPAPPPPLIPPRKGEGNTPSATEPFARKQCDSAIGEDLAAILYTSGSTGSPKGVMLSHRNLLAGTRIVANYLRITGEDRILSLLPLSFDYGLNQLLTAVQERATLVIGTFQLGNDIVELLARHRITGLAGVPTIWTILAFTAPRLGKTTLPDLRYVTNSGGALPTDIIRRLRTCWPRTDIVLMYGLTEAFRSTYLPPEEIDRRPTSIGKAIPECEILLVTPEGRRAAPGEPGILVHRGPTVSLGYWNRPEDTARVLRPNPLRPAAQGGETVCYSGDLVTADEDGFLYFVGRTDAMIKSAGFRISPTEVEEALMATGAFRQVAVIGLPDRLLGQRVHAVAIPATTSLDTAAILEGLADRLAAYMVPRGLDLVEALPLSPNGKVDSKRLVAERIQAAAA